VVNQDGLEPDFATGWRSSGSDPITFEHLAAIGYSDFSDGQLEGFYLAHFVTPGFILPDDVQPIELGFIGYYLHEGEVRSTSIFWLTLYEGAYIDWDVVEGEYQDWVNRDGLEPDFATGWRSSGSAPITFDHMDAIGHSDFTDGQLEGFYLAHYVTPGFILPDDIQSIELGLIGYYLHEGEVRSTSFFWLTLNEGDYIEWEVVEEAYQDWVSRDGLEPDFATGWRSSGSEPITFEHLATIGYSDFADGQLEGFHRAHFVSPGYILP